MPKAAKENEVAKSTSFIYHRFRKHRHNKKKLHNYSRTYYIITTPKHGRTICIINRYINP